jgi:hypothetical protein
VPAATKGAAADSSAATLRVLVAAGRDPAQAGQRLTPQVRITAAEVGLAVAVVDIRVAAVDLAAADSINL